jgi:hypothetical protein
MKEYVINLLQSKLDNELKQLEIDRQMLKGNGFRMAINTKEAFEKSRDIAYIRIDELYNALRILNLTTQTIKTAEIIRDSQLEKEDWNKIRLENNAKQINHFEELSKWIIENKRSVFEYADISTKSKIKILNELGYSSGDY